jgi:dTDP-4-amino-4,6-dideoxygalactose transaminase
MREIGGFFELELNQGKVYHENTMAFNSGANALHFFLQNSEYQTVYIPYFTCDVVVDVAKQLNLEVVFYKLDKLFRPKIDFSKLNESTVLIYNNYFGICGDLIEEVSNKTKHLIIDAAQAFYYKPKKGQFSFSSARKFFGVPDGGLLFGFSIKSTEVYEKLNYTSYKYDHLLIRLELGAQKGYSSYKQNEQVLSNVPIGKMSRATKALLLNVDHNYVKHSRINNFNSIHFALASDNELNFNSATESNVPLCYPYLCQNGKSLKEFLINVGVFVPTYWPNVKEWVKDDRLFEHHLCENLVCLPIDQRYGLREVEMVIKLINDFNYA